MIRASEAARVRLPTSAGDFEARAFEVGGGTVYLTLLRGDVAGDRPVLTRVHSECLTGDALESLRCDCGVQLHAALEAIAREGRGVLIYATGHEGRGIGLVNKLRAYQEQERGADTLDANLRLGLPADRRSYAEAAAVLAALGIRSVRLLTNNPRKADGLAAGGIRVDELVPLVTTATAYNGRYLRTKRDRMGHIDPAGVPLAEVAERPVDVSSLLGAVRPRAERPFVLVSYVQTLDGRIATRPDARVAAGRRLSHALRAACDAVLVGSGTVLAGDPELTVRLVPGPSPLRVVLDSRLRTPLTAKVLNGAAPTVVVTDGRDGTRAKRAALAARNVGVRLVEADPAGVDLHATLRALRADGVGSVVVEGGAGVIASMLAAGVVDRLVATIAPRIAGPAADGAAKAVGDLPPGRADAGLALTNRTVHPVGDDVLLTFDVASTPASTSTSPSGSGGGRG
jgi:3,4-dihydroxy 2-butanone 4-phosphate synthase/GTP cyclohydrolase II